MLDKEAAYKTEQEFFNDYDLYEKWINYLFRIYGINWQKSKVRVFVYVSLGIETKYMDKLIESDLKDNKKVPSAISQIRWLVKNEFLAMPKKAKYIITEEKGEEILKQIKMGEGVILPKKFKKHNQAKKNSKKIGVKSELAVGYTAKEKEKKEGLNDQERRLLESLNRKGLVQPELKNQEVRNVIRNNGMTPRELLEILKCIPEEGISKERQTPGELLKIFKRVKLLQYVSWLQKKGVLIKKLEGSGIIVLTEEGKAYIENVSFDGGEEKGNIEYSIQDKIDSIVLTKEQLEIVEILKKWRVYPAVRRIKIKEVSRLTEPEKLLFLEYKKRKKHEYLDIGWVAFKDESVLGYIAVKLVVSLNWKQGTIMNWYIEESFRDKGVGKALLKEALIGFASCGMTKVVSSNILVLSENRWKKMLKQTKEHVFVKKLETGKYQVNFKLNIENARIIVGGENNS